MFVSVYANTENGLFGITVITSCLPVFCGSLLFVFLASSLLSWIIISCSVSVANPEL